MKVIVAGYSKTGTKSMAAALTELGYNTYDYMEHFMHHYEEWMRIYGGKGSANDFKRMYENVDAVVDHPAYHFWKEIHDVFPDAKVRTVGRAVLRPRGQGRFQVDLTDFTKLGLTPERAPR